MDKIYVKFLVILLVLIIPLSLVLCTSSLLDNTTVALATVDSLDNVQLEDTQVDSVGNTASVMNTDDAITATLSKKWYANYTEETLSVVEVINFATSASTGGVVPSGTECDLGGNVSAYINGTVLTFYTTADKIYAPADSSYMFSVFDSGGAMTNCDASTINFNELFDTSNVTNMEGMFSYCTATSLDLSYFDTSNVTNMYFVFDSCSSLTSLNVSDWDTSNVQTMQNMFYNCGGLETLDIGDWVVSSVGDMSGMFRGCYDLTSLSLEQWDTSSVTDISYMFYNCSALSTLEISTWNTGNVTNMGYTFCSCYSLPSVELSNWDVSNVTLMNNMFAYDSVLTTIGDDVSNWDTGNVTSMASMFNKCVSLVVADYSNWEVGQVADMSYMFNYCSELVTLDVSGWDTGSVTTMHYMFYYCSKLGALDVSNWDTGSVTTMYGTFAGCSSLSVLDVEDWDTSSVTTFYATFQSCSTLTTLNTSEWDTSSATTLRSMFYLCAALTAVDVSGWDTSSVTTLYYMFYKCTSLTSIDVSSWDTSSVTTLSYMFYGCSKLTAFDAEDWDTSLVSSISYMFADCSKLASVNISNWAVTSVTTVSYLFNSCSSLTILDLSGWSLSSLTTASSVLTSCSSLQVVYTPTYIGSTSISLPTTYYGIEDNSTATTINANNVGTVITKTTSIVVVDYDLNNGTSDSVISTYGTLTNGYVSVTLPSQEGLSKNAYTFVGWSLSATGDSGVYEAGSTAVVASSVNSRLVTVYAIWQAQDITIVWDNELDGITNTIYNTSNPIEVYGTIVVGADRTITSTIEGNATFVAFYYYYNDNWYILNGATESNGTYYLSTDFLTEEFVMQYAINNTLTLRAVYSDVIWDFAVTEPDEDNGAIYISNQQLTFADGDQTLLFANGFDVYVQIFANNYYVIDTVTINGVSIGDFDGELTEFSYEYTINGNATLVVTYRKAVYSFSAVAVSTSGSEIITATLLQGDTDSDSYVFDGVIGALSAVTSFSGYVFMGWQYADGTVISLYDTYSLTGFDFDESKIVNGQLTIYAVYVVRYSLSILVQDDADYSVVYMSVADGQYTMVTDTDKPATIWVIEGYTAIIEISVPSGYQISYSSIGVIESEVGTTTLTLTVNSNRSVVVEFAVLAFTVNVYNVNQSGYSLSVEDNYTLELGNEYNGVSFGEYITLMLTDTQPNASTYRFSCVYLVGSDGNYILATNLSEVVSFMFDEGYYDYVVMSSAGNFINIYIEYWVQSVLSINVVNGDMGSVQLYVLEDDSYVATDTDEAFDVGSQFRLLVTADLYYYISSVFGAGDLYQDGYYYFSLDGTVKDIVVGFDSIQFAVSCVTNEGLNGELSEFVDTVSIGDTITLHFVPSSTYEIFGWTVNGVTQQVDNNSVSILVDSEFLASYLVDGVIVVDSVITTMMSRTLFYALVSIPILLIIMAVVISVLYIRGKKVKAEKNRLQKAVQDMRRKANFANEVRDLRNSFRDK